jgi:transcriptional regulator with XRE-family HTH domain
MEIKERISLIIKNNHMTPSAFADRIGANRSSISHVLSGRNKPGLDLLEKIVQHFPDINCYWLLTGVTNVNSDFQSIGSQVSKLNERQIKMESDRKEIVKIIEYFNDNTFKVYFPNEE